MKNLLMVLILLGSTTLFAQRTSITGTITDENGEPLLGATVQVSGTSQGTITDVDGAYTLDVPGPEAILVFSYVGYETQEIAVGNQTSISLTLNPDLLSLQEVVVVGYGTQKRSDITGAVASLTRERMDMTPNVSIAQAIQGSVPGVMVSTNSGGTNPDQTLLVRGRNSILADNEPLIVMDGIPYAGKLSDINPNDVQAIEVLKDASAAAIYGSRGSNGVILVTTKQGVAGKTVISYEGKYSLQRITNRIDYLTPDEYFDYKIERNEIRMTPSEREVHAAGTGVDWMDLAMRKGNSQEHNLSVSGGSEKTKC